MELKNSDVIGLLVTGQGDNSRIFLVL
uniref:Uncharacterized protein n=1 Tax=Arundo donax TaxID=35708 RepID=A0A0A8ZYJ3_ARUDO